MAVGRYSSHHPDLIYQAITDFIHYTPNEAKLRERLLFCYKENKNDFKRLHDDFSYLNTILFLPFKSYKDQREAADISERLFNVFFGIFNQKKPEDIQIKRFLFAHGTRQPYDIHPLSQITWYERVPFIKNTFYQAFFKEARQVFSPQEYVAWLTYPKGDGSSFVFTLLKYGDEESLKTGLDELRCCYDNHWLSLKQYIQVLTGANRNSFTPLLSAVHSTDASKNRLTYRTLALYLSHVRFLANKNADEKNFYAKVLFAKTNKNATGLDGLLVDGRLDSLSLVLAEIDEAYERGDLGNKNASIIKDKYANFLLGYQRNGATTLYKALLFGSKDTVVKLFGKNLHPRVLAYLTALNKAIAKGVISQERLKLCIKKVGHYQENNLHLAVYRGSLTLLNHYIEFVRRHFPDEEANEILHEQAISKNQHGFLPECLKQDRQGHVFENADAIMKILNELRSYKPKSNDAQASTSIVAEKALPVPKPETIFSRDAQKEQEEEPPLKKPKVINLRNVTGKTTSSHYATEAFLASMETYLLTPNNQLISNDPMTLTAGSHPSQSYRKRQH